MSRALPRRRGAAFGLIELLVVICIIAVLAVFLLPRLTGGKDPLTGKKSVSPRDRAVQVQTVSYVGQINQAISMYRMDNDGQNPPDLMALKSYGVTQEMMIDPATGQMLPYDPRTGRVGGTAGPDGGMGGGQYLPQVGGAPQQQQQQPAPGPGGVRLPDMSHPGATAALSDE
jgi:Type II secretory pathway, pseudopilin PulG